MTDIDATTPAVMPTVDEKHDDFRNYPQGVAFLDGQFLPMREAKISVLDWGFLHSDATYDTAHVWEGRFFRLNKHLDRFWNGMKRLRMSIPYSRNDVQSILETCVALSGHRNSYVEMICTRGSSPSFSRDPRDSENRFMAFAVPYGSVANAEQMERGLRVVISSSVRIPPTSVDPTIKNYHWLDLVKGLYDAYDAGGETALLLDTDGNVAEGPGFNVFMVKDGALSTPEFGVLPGITRQSIFDIAEELGRPVGRRPISREEIYQADEVFITSTAGGVMPVTRIDGKNIADGAVGHVTKRLKQVYWDKHWDPEWSHPVDYGLAGSAE